MISYPHEIFFTNSTKIFINKAFFTRRDEEGKKDIYPLSLALAHHQVAIRHHVFWGCVIAKNIRAFYGLYMNIFDKKINLR
tara:strand:+ start:412 stop:654 length:243 start_codon:yes stop_codon:yes gene_type:complete